MHPSFADRMTPGIFLTGFYLRAGLSLSTMQPMPFTYASVFFQLYSNFSDAVGMDEKMLLPCPRCPRTSQHLRKRRFQTRRTFRPFAVVVWPLKREEGAMCGEGCLINTAVSTIYFKKHEHVLLK